jgi:phage tail-like protein
MPGKLLPLGLSHFKVTLGGMEAAGFFRGISAQGARIDHDKFPYVSDPGNPVTAYVAGGGAVSYQEPLTLTRGLDEDKKMWDWFHQVLTQFDGAAAQKEMTIELMDYKNQPSGIKFKAVGVWPVSYKTSDWNVQGSRETAVESVGLVFETWERF